MKKFIFCIVIICCCCLISCKSSYTAINDKKEGIIINLPKNTIPINPDSLKDKYSDLFYRILNLPYPSKGTEIFTWDHTFQINTNIIIGFNCKDGRVYENMERERRRFEYAINSASDGVNYKTKDEIINSRLFWLGLYKAKDNEEDYFVSFRSDGSKVNHVWGKIRFPASYPLEEIEKQTTKILSGIKFQF
ncbi:hypothetical protein [Viscerimonas tarda]